MSVPLVVMRGNKSELSQLPRRQHAIGNSDAEHRRQTLNIEPVLQTQGKKFGIGELAFEIAIRLASKLYNAFFKHRSVITVISVHRLFPLPAQ